jgi:hypothetical protein
MDLNIVDQFTVGGQTLILDKAFVTVLGEAFLVAADVQHIGKSVYDFMARKAMVVPQSKILLIVDGTPNNSGMLLGYAPVTTHGENPEANLITGMVCAFSKNITDEAVKIKSECARLEKKSRRQTKKRMLQAKMRFSIAHELTHAFGINTTNSRLKSIPIIDLELLTDSIAYVSCSAMIGKDEATLGASYIGERLKQTMQNSDATAFAKFAADTIETFFGMA